MFHLHLKIQSLSFTICSILTWKIQSLSFKICSILTWKYKVYPLQYVPSSLGKYKVYPLKYVPSSLENTKFILYNMFPLTLRKHRTHNTNFSARSGLTLEWMLAYPQPLLNRLAFPPLSHWLPHSFSWPAPKSSLATPPAPFWLVPILLPSPLSAFPSPSPFV